RLQALTQRPVRIERLELSAWKGMVTIHGLHIRDRARQEDLAAFERLDVRVGLTSLARGRLRIREATLERPIVRVVRSTQGFNISDLFQGSAAPMRPLDFAVDRFELHDGTVTLEDRALSEPRTWVSEKIEVRAKNVSTRTGDGVVEATSITAGAPAS